MPDIKERDGVIVLEADSFDLKIDKSRKIYVKSKSETTYSFTGHLTPEGMSSIEKKKFLYEVYRQIEAKLAEEEKNI